MISLYLKTHNVTGLKYLGKTSADPLKYKGSGRRWMTHIAKHGNDVTTIVLAECETNDEIKKLGLYYSQLWDVVSSPNFANLKEEAGDGGSHPHTENTKQRISAAKKGSVSPTKGKQWSEERRSNAKMRRTGDGNPMFGKFIVNNGETNLTLNVGDDIPVGYTKGAIQNHVNKRKNNAKNTGSNNPNFGRFWITNGIVNKMISGDIPAGWSKGRKM